MIYSGSFVSRAKVETTFLNVALRTNERIFLKGVFNCAYLPIKRKSYEITYTLYLD